MMKNNNTDELYYDYISDDISNNILNDIEEYETNENGKNKLYYTSDRFKDTDEYKKYLKEMAELNPGQYPELEYEDNNDDENNKWFNIGSNIRKAIVKNKKFIIFLTIFTIITILNNTITKLNGSNNTTKTENRQDITEEDMEKLGISDVDILSHPLVQEAISYLSEEEKEELFGSEYISVSQNDIKEKTNDEEIKLLNTKAVNISSLYNEQNNIQEQENEIVESEIYYIKGNGDLQVVLDGYVKTIYLIGIENTYDINQLKSILNIGSKVYIEYDNNKYNSNGELIAYIWLENPEQLEEGEYSDNLLNALILKNGWTKTNIDDINIKYKNVLIDAEDYAIYNKIGCWN